MHLHFNSAAYCCVFREHIAWFIVSSSAYSTSLSLSSTSAVSNSKLRVRWNSSVHLYICSSHLHSVVRGPNLPPRFSPLSTRHSCANAPTSQRGVSAPLHMASRTESHYPWCFLSCPRWGQGIPRVSVTTRETPLSHRCHLWRHWSILNRSRDPAAVGIAMYFTSSSYSINMSINISVLFDLFFFYNKLFSYDHWWTSSYMHWFLEKALPLKKKRRASLPFSGLSWHDFSSLLDDLVYTRSYELPLLQPFAFTTASKRTSGFHHIIQEE